MTQIDEVLDYKFVDTTILESALTHSSYSKQNYERLEFLGDAVLEMIVSNKLFLRKDLDEGELTNIRANIVNGKNLAKVFDCCGFDKFVKLSKSVKTITSSIKEDIVEAIIGALYVDGGIEIAQKFVDKYILTDTDKLIPQYDFKTKLQEVLQCDGSVKIEYIDKNKIDDIFYVELYVNNELVSCASGSSKKIAQQKCAEIALNNIKN